MGSSPQVVQPSTQLASFGRRLVVFFFFFSAVTLRTFFLGRSVSSKAFISLISLWLNKKSILSNLGTPLLVALHVFGAIGNIPWCFSAATEADFRFQDTAPWASPRGQRAKSLLEGEKKIKLTVLEKKKQTTMYSASYQTRLALLFQCGVLNLTANHLNEQRSRIQDCCSVLELLCGHAFLHCIC